MTVLRKPSIAFTAGAFGALFLVLLLYAIQSSGVARLPGNSAVYQSKGFIYKIVVWGGLWGLFLVLPVLEKQWWLRGLLLGVAASLANMFYFNTGLQSAAALAVAGLFIFNMIWGIAAAFWYASVAKG